MMGVQEGNNDDRGIVELELMMGVSVVPTDGLGIQVGVYGVTNDDPGVGSYSPRM